ncbi:MAG: hypothetical protein WD850_01105 [Candidatus Spechtbacterales bacterium]
MSYSKRLIVFLLVMAVMAGGVVSLFVIRAGNLLGQTSVDLPEESGEIRSQFERIFER